MTETNAELTAIVITKDGKRHELDMPHEPNATEWAFIPGYGRITLWFERFDGSNPVYRQKP
jgi:hypothetical protein